MDSEKSNVRDESRPTNKRVILLIDMDCFYVQVEQRFCPEAKGKPCAVVQYKSFQGGSIIAVSYEARKFGIRRFPGMSGNEAKKLCPEIRLFQIPEKRGKANLDKYRESCREVMDIFLQKVPLLERASVDEAFLDITDIVHERILTGQTKNLDLFQELHDDTLVAHYDPDDVSYGNHGQQCDTLLRDDFDDTWSETDDHTHSDVEEKDDEFFFQNATSDGVSIDCRLDGTLPNDQLDLASETEDEGEEALVSGDFESSQEKRKEALKVWLSREGQQQDLHLAVGAVVAKELRKAVYDKLGFTCSAGISYNKVLAKLAAGMNKPNGQTVLPPSSVGKTFDVTPIKKVRNFGGKFGIQVQKDFNVEHIGQLRQFSVKELAEKYGDKSGKWLYNICRGVDDEPLRVRYLSKSISCGKNFLGPEKLKSPHQVQMWLHNFAEELVERMEMDKKANHRVPTLMSVYIRHDLRDTHGSYSRSGPVISYKADKLAEDAWKALCRPSKGREAPIDWASGVVCMGMSLSKFQTLGGGRNPSSTLHAFFSSKQGNCSGTANTTSHDMGTPRPMPSIVKEESSPKKQKKGDIRSFLLGSSQHNADKVKKDAEFCRPRVLVTPRDRGVTPRGSLHSSSDGSSGSHDQAAQEFVNQSPDNLSQLLGAAGVSADVFKNLPDNLQCEILQDIAKYGCDNRVQATGETHPCEICGEQVKPNEVQIHSDHHLAQQLSQPHPPDVAASTEDSDGPLGSTSRKRPPRANHLEPYLKRMNQRKT